jgi:hypothetical protein
VRLQLVQVQRLGFPVFSIMLIIEGGLMRLMMDDDARRSQVIQVVLGTEVSRRKNNREWSKKAVQHLLNICEEKYWEYNRQSFREKN